MNSDSLRVIHRADYHQVLWDEAVASGAKIRLGQEVTDIEFERTSVVVSDGSAVAGNVIVGADGNRLWKELSAATTDMISLCRIVVPLA